MGCSIQIANGANLRSIKNLIPYVMRIEDNSILFIDEIHRMTNIVEEFLYPVMEDFKVDMSISDKKNFGLLFTSNFIACFFTFEIMFFACFSGINRLKLSTTPLICIGRESFLECPFSPSLEQLWSRLYSIIYDLLLLCFGL